MQIMDKIKTTIHYEKLRLKKKGMKNILFGLFLLFLMIYSTSSIAQSYWPNQIQDRTFWAVKISFIIHFGCQVLYFLLYLPGYLQLLPYYQKFIISPEIPRPWQRKDWKQLRLKTIKILILNICILYPLFFYYGMKYTGGVKFRFDNFPSMLFCFNFRLQITFQLMALYYIEDFFNYSIHRCFHEVQFLKKYHKVHHEYNSNFTLVSEYTHPIDWAISNMTPSFLAFMIIGKYCHCYIFFLWHIYKLYASKEAHSGYQFPFSPTRLLFFVGGPSYHDFHHSKNVGNYAGSVFIYDIFLSKQPTNTLYFLKLQQQLNSTDKLQKSKQ